ncbi:MAG: hypothetical protein K6E13_09235 [Lachnospiraceae bacterium]|nr:hypothetical protein [Lachnospiraceae bacterium]
MFGNSKKKIAELETEISKINREKNDLSDSIGRDISALRENRENMDSILNGIVDTVKTNEGVGDNILNAVSKLESNDSKDSGTDELNQAINDCTQNAKDGLSKIKNDVSDLNGPKAEIAKSKDTIAGSMRTMTTRLETLKNDAHQMAVISLHAAIEAGKLGGVGKGFITASEQIRSTAEGYEEKLNEALADVDTAMKKIEQLEMFIGSLNDIYDALLKDTDEAKDSIKAPVVEDYIDTSADEAKTSIINDIKSSVDDLKYNVENVLKDMESLGSCFVKMQETEEKLNEENENMKRV